MEREISYETLPSGVPKILQDDWNVTFQNETEKEIVIKIFEWKFGPQDIYSDMKLEPWQDGLKVNFTKGLFKGKISFSLNREKIDIINLMKIIILVTIGLKNGNYYVEKYIGTGLYMADFFRSATNVYALPDNVQRCLFLKIIKLSNNKTDTPVKKDRIYELFDSENLCCYRDVFRCVDYNHNENACGIKNETIDKKLLELENKKVIRIVDTDIYIR